MTQSSQSSPFIAVPRVAGVVVAAMGAFVLAGWWLHIPWIRSVLPGAVQMKVNTALGLMGSGVALFLLEGARKGARVWVGLALAWVVAAIGIATGVEYIYGKDLGLDQFLFHDVVGPFNAIPGRMSPYTAAVFATAGLGLAGWPWRFLRWAARGSAALALMVGGASIIGYLWHATELVTDRFIPPVAINTAAAFVILGMGMLSGSRGIVARADWGWSGLSRIEKQTLGGFLAALALLLMVGGYTYRSAVDAAESARWVTHTQQVRAGLNGLHALVLGAALDQRNYLLTGKPEDRVASERQAAEAGAEAEILVRFVSDNLDQSAAMKDLRQAVAGLAGVWSAGNRVFAAQGLAAAQTEIGGPNETQLMEQIRGLISRLDSTEEKLLVGRENDYARDKVRTLLSLLLTMAAAVAGLMGLFGGIRREIAQRTAAEAEIQQWNKTLEERVAARTAEAQAQVGRLDLLSRTTRAIGERQDLASICQVVVRSLEDHLPIDFGCVCLYDASHQTLRVISVGVKSEALAEDLAMGNDARILIDENGLSRCVRGHLVYEPDITAIPSAFPQRLAKGGLKALVVAPLAVESSIFGVLVAARKEANSFESADCEFLRQLSEHTALAAHQAQLYGALQQAYDDLRQTQQAVMDQERLRALGQMASGIAHDINNAISPIGLYTESLLETEPNLSARARDYLQTIQRAIEDVAQTVARMKEFYRHRETQLTLAPLSLNQMAQQVIQLSRARWNDIPQQRGVTVRMETELDPKLPEALGVESEIREALVNLIFNAVDAMPEGGTLTLRTKVVGDQAHVEVSDTGGGMSEETRRRCLEPFFTTKGERGTGLGLAMVYGAVRRHNAQIEIDSELGKGTTVRIIFQIPTTMPLSSRAAAVTPEMPARSRILMVDDDPLLIKSLRDTLETDGHIITAATGGQAGIEAFAGALEKGQPFAVVITDLGMPNVDGRKVAAAIKGMSATTPIIMLTGWGQRLVTEGDIPPHVDQVLSKPPKLRELRAALAACLAQNGASAT